MFKNIMHIIVISLIPFSISINCMHTPVIKTIKKPLSKKSLIKTLCCGRTLGHFYYKHEMVSAAEEKRKPFCPLCKKTPLRIQELLLK